MRFDNHLLKACKRSFWVSKKAPELPYKPLGLITPDPEIAARLAEARKKKARLLNDWPEFQMGDVT